MTHRAPIAIAPYDPAWPRHFEAERRSLLALLAPLSARIEHVGSTAVPGLDAKPIVDILLGCARIEEFEPFIAALEASGWEYHPEHELEHPERRFLAKPRVRPRRFHLHAVAVDTEFWRRHLLFRDHLRRNSEVAAAYGQLKRSLAERLGDDREAYTRAKTDFIASALCRAEAELAGRGGPGRPGGMDR